MEIINIEANREIKRIKNDKGEIIELIPGKTTYSLTLKHLEKEIKISIDKLEYNKIIDLYKKD